VVLIAGIYLKCFNRFFWLHPFLFRNEEQKNSRNNIMIMINGIPSETFSQEQEP
jgi:hypothetical protein